MNIEDLKDPELQKKLMEAKSPEELLEISKACGVSLSDEQLAAVAGAGDFWCWLCQKDETNLDFF